MNSIVWFKTDLRITDNETLIRAIEKSDYIVPIYCFNPEHYKTTPFGFKKTGGFRAQFLLESIDHLQKQLKLLGSNLILLYGKPEVEIPKIVSQYKIKKVFAKREVAYEEKQTEALVQNELFKLKCELETFSTSTLYHAEDLPFSIKDIPDVFTNFRKKTEKDAIIRPVFKTPQAIKSPQMPEFELPNLSQFDLKFQEIDQRAAFQFKGGEAEAMDRLQYYFFSSQLVSNYKITRNEMIGTNYSSKFSPWLALGCISPRIIYQEIKKFEAQFQANESTYWLIFELLWRDYFRFMMKKHKEKFFHPLGIHNKKAKVQKIDQKKLQNWIQGKTGVDFIDANMNELNLTGFMSNRGRQNVASYFCNDLKLDWRYGAAYFEQQLIDYDVCSNWGNWAYLAGVGNDPRGNRYFDINKQAKEYDKNNAYRKLWLSL